MQDYQRRFVDFLVECGAFKLGAFTLKSGRLSREVSDACLQYWGGMGYTFDNPISQSYRDSRLISIGGGADEVMLGIICKLEGTLPGKAP